MFILMLACAVADPAAETSAEVTQTEAAFRRTQYAGTTERLKADRTALSKRYLAASSTEKHKVLAESRTRVLDALTREIFPFWEGTPWSFYGSTQVPQEGEIACGYFVSTTLRDAGFRVERVRLAQQASSLIIESLTGAQDTLWLGADVEKVVSRIEKEEEALWVVGLDYHVGYLWHHDQTTTFCHSSYLGAATVVCEDARTSPAMVSNVHVIGKLFDDEMMDRWLREKKFSTVVSN